MIGLEWLTAAIGTLAAVIGTLGAFMGWHYRRLILADEVKTAALGRSLDLMEQWMHVEKDEHKAINERLDRQTEVLGAKLDGIVEALECVRLQIKASP